MNNSAGVVFQPENRIQVLDEGNWRFEYKYRLPVQQYLRVKNFIKPYMEIDEYTDRAPGRKYLVRSLYYDSIFLDAFNEKIDGNSDRIKFRIRTYAERMGEGTVLRAEMKVRKGAITEKHGSFIKDTEYLAFIETRHWPEVRDPVLAEFERYVHLKTLEPMLLTQYLREGYRSRSREEIRITFDHHVTSAHSDRLFPAAPRFHDHHYGLIVLEIKCIREQPDWLRQLVQEHGLRIMANSKFVQGMMAAYPAMVTPSWSA